MNQLRLYSLFLVSALTAVSQHSDRDFMARWSYSAPQHHDKQVNVRVSLRLWNLGQHNLNGGTIEIREHSDLSKRVEAANLVSVEKGRSRTFHVYLNISEEEFQSWEKGLKPDLVLSFRDPDGNLRLLPVDVSPAMGDDNEK